MVEGSPSEFPSMSCAFREDDVALADAILSSKSANGLWKLTADLLGPEFAIQFKCSLVTEILRQNRKAGEYNAFEFSNLVFKIKFIQNAK